MSLWQNAHYAQQTLRGLAMPASSVPSFGIDEQKATRRGCRMRP